MMIRNLSKSWRELAQIFRNHADKPLALAYEKCASELEEALSEEGDRLLTLREAAEMSGYSADHLGRAVREGKIPNAGRHRAPRIRLRDLPKKAVEQLPSPGKRGHNEDATAIVQSVINQ